MNISILCKKCKKSIPRYFGTLCENCDVHNLFVSPTKKTPVKDMLKNKQKAFDLVVTGLRLNEWKAHVNYFHGDECPFYFLMSVKDRGNYVGYMRHHPEIKDLHKKLGITKAFLQSMYDAYCESADNYGQPMFEEFLKIGCKHGLKLNKFYE